MASFHVISLPDDLALGHAVFLAVTRRLAGNFSTVSTTEVAPDGAAWPGAQSEEVAAIAAKSLAADGTLLLLGGRRLADAAGLAGFLDAALTAGPVAVVIEHKPGDQPAVASQLVSHLIVERGLHCFPRIVAVAAPADGEKLSTADDKLILDLVKEFTVYAAAIKLFTKTVGLPDPRIDAADTLKVNHLNVLTRDLGKSLAFYREIVGAKHLYNLGPHKAVTELDGFEFFIEQVENVVYPPGFHFGLRSTARGVSACYERLKAADVKFVKGNNFADGVQKGIDKVRTAFYFEDPDGLLVEVYSPELAMIERSSALLQD